MNWVGIHADRAIFGIQKIDLILLEQTSFVPDVHTVTV
jgi:hypothetical protein